MGKIKLSILFVFFSQMVFCQLSNFGLTVVSSNETCTANGTITISVNNTTVGATMLYSIYKLPDITTPISVQSATTLGGLTSGTYRVVATQSLGNENASKQQDVIITNQISPLSYTLDSKNELCGNDGEIIVSTVTGIAQQYEIISGPVTRPLQTSNIFTGLTAGLYQIRVISNCNEGVVQSYTLFSDDPTLSCNLNPPSLSSCTMVSVGFSFSTVASDGVVAYPLAVTTTVFPPTGSPIVSNSTITSGSGFSTSIPYYNGQSYNYSFSITDACGENYVLNGSVQTLSTSVSYTVLTQNCTQKSIKFSDVVALTLTAAPSTYLNSIPQNFTSQIINNQVTINNLGAGTYIFNATNLCGVAQVISIVIEISEGNDPYHILFNRTCSSSSLLIFDISQLILTSSPTAYNVTLPQDYTNLINNANYAAFVNFPVGVYVFSVIDLCGQPKIMTITIEPLAVPPTVTVLEGCNDNVGSFKVSGLMQSINLISAPSSFATSFPVDYTSSLISGNSALVLDMLPPGSYTFEITDSCNIPYTKTAVVLGYTDNTILDVQANCGSFNLNLNHTSSNNNDVKFWLQKYNPNTNSWEHPFTGNQYLEGVVPIENNSFLIQNNASTFNLATLGDFRIVKSYKCYIENSLALADCIRVLEEFEFKGVPQIIDIYSISCGATFEVIVDAVGLNPLVYRIKTKNNLPFLIENGSSYLFSNLEPAIYNFEVEDGCNNTVNRFFEVLNPNPLEITTNSTLCNGENVTLIAPNFDFLEYEWWKNNNTTTILSTNNSLVFPSFDSNANNGTYSVRIMYDGNPNSCLNQVLSYTINADTTLPNAGQGGNFSYCGTQNTVDLNSLLQGTFDTDGIWTETSGSGTLSGNLWNSTNVAFGTYSFTYRVDGNCNLFDEAIINITLKEIPDVPIASSNAIICETKELNLYSTTISNGTYNWVGPNGFSSSEQNPVIENISNVNNGIYTVNVVLNECPSETASIEIFVNKLPEFELFQNCINSEYVLSYEIQNNDAAVETDYDFSWFGSNNFSSTENQVTITRGETGIYNLTITDLIGCSATKDINVVRTICEIPNVITPNNDGSNDSLDLTGFGVKKIEIYNRWGRLVYDKVNYSNEWHGQNNNGESLPDSTYYYLIQMENETSTKVGWIYVTKG